MVQLVAPPLPDRFLAFLGTVVFATLVSLGVTTLGWSIYKARQDRRKAAAKPELRGELLERLGATEPGWAEWVATLDDVERGVLQELLREYLLKLRGGDRERLRDLGEAMGLVDKARAKLPSADPYDTLAGLTWLSLLEAPVETDVLETHCRKTQDTRAAAARVLSRQDHPDGPAVGTALLVDPGASLSTLGLDTLYRLNELDPTPLLARAGEDADTWENALLIQALRVIGECNPVDSKASIDWIPALFDHESPAVRAAAANALAGYGWHSGLRESIDLDAVCLDESRQVRRAVYRMLGEWGDEDARARLEDAVHDDADARARLAAAEELFDLIDEPEPSPPGDPAPDAGDTDAFEQAFSEAADGDPLSPADVAETADAAAASLGPSADQGVSSPLALAWQWVTANEAIRK